MGFIESRERGSRPGTPDFHRLKTTRRPVHFRPSAKDVLDTSDEKMFSTANGPCLNAKSAPSTIQNPHQILPVVTRMTLTAANDDILFLIITALCYTNSFHPLCQIHPLSLTCKRFRQFCLPFMFRSVEWPNQRISAGLNDTKNEAEMIPESLLPFIR